MWRCLLFAAALMLTFCQTALADLHLPASLVTQFGKPFSAADTKGRPIALFFGFTNCPDICPTTLLDMSNDFAALGGQGKDIRMIFVTVDPEHDTPEILQEYLSSFDPRITALTGPSDSISTLARTYGASFRKVPIEGGYTIEHSPAVFLIGRTGELHGIMGYDEDQRTRLEKLRELLK
jgi:protein SCO1/2